MPLARARADAARRRVGALASHAPLDLASTSARSSAPAPPPVVAPHVPRVVKIGASLAAASSAAAEIPSAPSLAEYVVQMAAAPQ